MVPYAKGCHGDALEPRFSEGSIIMYITGINRYNHCQPPTNVSVITRHYCITIGLPSSLQVDLGYEISVTGVAIQGQDQSPNFVLEFYVSSSSDLNTWTDHSEPGDESATVSHSLIAMCELSYT